MSEPGPELPTESKPPAEDSETLAGLDPSLDMLLLCGLLFLLTCFSTFLAGISSGGPPPATLTWDIVQRGLSYSVPLMAILLCHEMGHYLQARRHKVPATLPFFIPTPEWLGLFGTMGAIIVQDGRTLTRRSLFDIAVSGPIAGLVIALPVVWYGVSQARIEPIPVPGPGQIAVSFGDPLILRAMVWAQHGPLPAGHDINASPVLFAGWIGLFLTGLNLLPIGQLDGGHTLYALLGKRAHPIALIAWTVLVAYMLYAQYWGYVLFAVLLAIMGLRHPPTTDDAMPLGTGRTIVGWLTMALLVGCFIPQPVQIHFGPELPAKPAQEARSE